MLNNPFTEAGLFLISLVFGIASFVFLMRWLLEVVGADFYNPISQFVVKMTQPILRPLRFIPSFRKFNLACLCVVLGIEWLKFFVMAGSSGVMVRGIGFLVSSVGATLQLLIDIYFFLIIVRVIASWILTFKYNPVLSLIYQLTDPLLNWARRFLPPIGILDLSPVLVLIALQLINILIARPLIQLGMGVFTIG